MRKALGVFAAAMLCVSAARAGTINVDMNDGGCVSGSGQADPYAVVYCGIQDAIDDAAAGDVINVAAGTYSAPLNIESRDDLTIVGADRDTVIIQPASTLDWGQPYGAARQVSVRVYGSTDITISNLTLDCDVIKGNNVIGALYWNSTGAVDGCLLENMSVPDASGGYYEIMCYVRAPDFTDAARAEVVISGCEFVDAGRVGIVTHEYVNVTIMNNMIYKTEDDFGYAIELGSASIGVISGNEIFGFDTPALSDGSSSGGIYIENSFTMGFSGITKTVTVLSNEIYGCEYGLWLGNSTDGYAGDVDIEAYVLHNRIHDNIEAGILLMDEDKSAGSSVTATFNNNVIYDNTIGYFINTAGDGDITATISNEQIYGGDVGIYVDDYATGASGSTYDISISNSIAEGVSAGLYCDYDAIVIDAEDNWWGDASGPLDTEGEDETDGVTCYAPATMSNVDGLGGEISEYVDYCPWLGGAPARLALEADADCYAAGDTVTVAAWMRDQDSTIVSGQFYLGYDNAMLDFQSITTGDAPFTQEIYEVVNETAGTIDYAAGIAGGGAGTSADSRLAIVTFEALQDICEEEALAIFRTHNPPTRLGDDQSTPVYPLLIDLDVIDDEAPTATTGAIAACYVSAAEAEAAALAATTDLIDNCADSADLTTEAATVGDCEAVVTVTVTDPCGNFTDYIYNTRVDAVDPSATVGTIAACYATATEAETAAVAATTGASDNCTDPIDITLTASTIGDCDATVTVRVEDECGNYTDYEYYTRVDNTPPTATQGTIDACYASEAVAEAAALAATTGASDNCSDSIDITLTASTVGDCDATVTVRVEDECGNYTDYDYFTRIDDEDPVVTPPADLNVHADAGLCTATVEPGVAWATDNCSASLTVVGTRDDALALADPYPFGVTTITWATTDECGNSHSADQLVTVDEFNELIVNVELAAVTEPSLTRCITFEFHDCTLDTFETVEQEITFTSGLATGASVLVDCGVYDCLRVRDGLHSLWRTDNDDFAIDGLTYVADLTAAGDDDALIGGNLFDDVPPYAPPQFIDIMDYAVFVNNWATDYGTGDTTCATVWPHADISGDGEVSSADFTFIQTYFLYTDEPTCCGVIGGGGAPLAEVSTTELRERGLGRLTSADLNRDGWVNEADIAAFINGVRPKQSPLHSTPSISAPGGLSMPAPGGVAGKSVRP